MWFKVGFVVNPIKILFSFLLFMNIIIIIMIMRQRKKKKSKSQTDLKDVQYTSQISLNMEIKEKHYQHVRRHTTDIICLFNF